MVWKSELGVRVYGMALNERMKRQLTITARENRHNFTLSLEDGE